jgi:chromosomal replication initiation ATPase DnaA
MKALLTLLSQRIDPHKFEIWIARCQFAGVEGGALVLSVPNRDFVSICERLQEEIMAAIKELAMPFSGVRFESRGCGGEE